MKYQLIAQTDIHNLERCVNEAIAEGWVPLGGVSHSCLTYEIEDRKGYCEREWHWSYVQAMTKSK